MKNNLGLSSMAEERQQVNIIGIGLVTSGGNSVSETWSSILAGQSSISPVSGEYLTKTRHAHFMAPLHHSIDVAIKQATYGLPKENPIDFLIVGSSSASYRAVELSGAPILPGRLTEQIASRWNITKRYQISQACSSSGAAISLGVDLIRLGLANVVLAGGADEVTQSVMSAFEAVRIHGEVCRPFDLNRKDINLGEAAAFVLLARDGILPPLAKITGIGNTSDGSDPVMPSDIGIRSCIAQAVHDSGNKEIDFVIAHGTGTQASDEAESIAINNALGVVRTASFKGAIGHPQGSSGAVSVVLAVKAIQEKRIFPTVGFTTPDPKIASRILVSKSYQDANLANVLCLSFGTWGSNSAIIVSRKDVQ